MKTFEELKNEMVNEMYKSPEGWPASLSMTRLFERVANEYASLKVEAEREKVKNIIQERIATYKKDVLTDQFKNGAFWECKYFIELIDSLQ